MKPIRNSAKAIIIDGNKILLIENKDDLGYWYCLPGGGQNPGENLMEAVVRECQEELGAIITVGDILFIRDYIGKNHEFHSTDYNDHQVELMFECFLTEKYMPMTGVIPDPMQVGVAWIDLNEIYKYRIYPKELTKFLGDRELSHPIYLGDVN